MQVSLVGLARLLDLLTTTEPRPASDDGTHPVTRERGPLDIENLRYSYVTGREVLHGLSVRVEPGERVGLVGPTGSGNTTLAKFMTGLHTPVSGTVRYYEDDLASLPPAELRRRIVLVPQRVHMIEGTLLDHSGSSPAIPSRRPSPGASNTSASPAGPTRSTTDSTPTSGRAPAGSPRVNSS
ncbi:ATP-binding cassette domain-containing protein [Streptomyces cyaneofuscatus]|uniref:ATP-binding cassette domain-containing protein n=1 Tax=Streptomyces cyaneofuscatus TaxID=66883 RepID=UPI0036864070